MAIRASCRKLVGRGEEQAELRAALARAQAGSTTTAVVAGSAGVGKTRLVDDLAEAARDAGALVITAACVPLAEGLLPYGPIADAFRDAAGQLGLHRLRSLLGPCRPAVELLSPDLADGPSATPLTIATADAPPLGPLLLGAFTRLAAEHILVVAIDDLQWADPSTLDLLALTARARQAPMLWIVTARADELDPRHPLRATLGDVDRAGAIRIDLGPLGRDGVAAQIAGIAGHEPDAAFVDRIFRRSEGNPLFTEELLAAGGNDDLPASLSQLVLARVNVLPAAARQVVDASAVSGRVVDHALLARVVELAEPDVLDAVRFAVANNVLVAQSGTYVFRHPLIQEAVAAALLPGESARLHRRYAEALTARPARRATTSAELAHHWQGAGEADRALAAHVQAGRDAKALHAMAEANQHFEQAIALWGPDDSPRADAGIDLAGLYQRASGTACMAGNTERAIALVDEALARPSIRDDPVTAGLLYERLGRYLWTSRADEHLTVAMYERAVERVPSMPTVARARVLGGLAQILMLLGHYRRSATTCEEAIAIAVQIGARREEGDARNTLGVDLINLGRPDDGVDSLRASLTIAHETGNVEDLHRAHNNLALTLMSFPRLDEALAIAREGLELNRRHGVLATQGAFSLSIVAEILYFQGRWSECAAALSQAVIEPGYPVAAAAVNRMAGVLASAQGRRDEAEERLAAAVVEGSGRGDTGNRALLATAWAEHHLVNGLPDEALRVVAGAAAELSVTDETHLLARLAALGFGALAARPSPDDRTPRGRRRQALPAGCERLAELVAESPTNAVPPETAAHLAQARALRDQADGRHDTGAWAAVAERWLVLGRPYPAAWARLRQAEAVLGSHGERDVAREALEEANRTAARIGAEPLRRATQRLARRARLPFAAGESHAADPTLGLSPREVEVLALVADGRTNRQIAEALYISERTAGVHLSHILTKLGVANRGEAAATARRLGLDS